MAENIYPVFDRIYDRKVKEEILRQSAKVIWFTGTVGIGEDNPCLQPGKGAVFPAGFSARCWTGIISVRG